MGYGIDKISQTERRWQFPIHYVFDGDGLSKATREMLAHAMEAWSQIPGVAFIEGAHKNGPTVRVKSTSGSNMWSAGDTKQGYNPGAAKQEARHNVLFLQDMPDLNLMIHEVGHMLGLAHEHDRPDGGVYRSTQMNHKNSFAAEIAESVAKASAEVKGYKTYGDFDADSVMIYGANATPKPSAGDLATVREIYDL
ncbi:MAG: M12 family metallopeptidase [Myxococcota bacterium]